MAKMTKSKMTKSAVEMKPIPKMDQRVKKKWVKALQSGEYAQGNSYLLNAEEETYCCLGVLCLVTGKPKAKIRGRGVPDNSLLKKVKLDHCQMNKLIHYNDSCRWSFNRIASYINRYM